MNRKIEIEQIRKMLEMRKNGDSFTHIGKELGVDKDTVRRYCVLYGVDGVDQLSPQYTEEQGEAVADMYLNKGMTPSEIAFKLGRSPQGIRKYLLRHGLKKPRAYTPNKDAIDKIKLPDPIIDPVFYPDRKITPKKVSIQGKRYQDVSEVYGL